jgi:hypothetical protein
VIWSLFCGKGGVCSGYVWRVFFFVDILDLCGVLLVAVGVLPRCHTVQ